MGGLPQLWAPIFTDWSMAKTISAFVSVRVQLCCSATCLVLAEEPTGPLWVLMWPTDKVFSLVECTLLPWSFERLKSYSGGFLLLVRSPAS